MFRGAISSQCMSRGGFSPLFKKKNNYYYDRDHNYYDSTSSHGESIAYCTLCKDVKGTDLQEQVLMKYILTKWNKISVKDLYSQVK